MDGYLNPGDLTGGGRSTITSAGPYGDTAISRSAESEFRLDIMLIEMVCGMDEIYLPKTPGKLFTSAD